MVARSIRNNNPGNIVYGDYAKKMGATGTDGRFAIFPSWEVGSKAMENLLFGSSYAGKGLTVQQGIYKWAPPSENDSGSYATTVAKKAGVSASTPLSSLTASQRTALLNAMAGVEAGGNVSVASSGKTYGPAVPSGYQVPQTMARVASTPVNTNVVLPADPAQMPYPTAPSTNLNDYGPTPGSPKSTWLQPLAWFAPREVQLGARVTF